MDRNNMPPAVSNTIIFRKFIPITIVVILTLIQGLLVVGCLSIAYFSYDCNPSPIDLGMILYFKYFGGNNCDSIPPASTKFSHEAQVHTFSKVVLATIGDVSPKRSSITIEEFNRELPEVVSVAKRVQIELIIYGVISVLWIITSLLALVSCLCKYVGKVPFFVSFVPWFIAIVTGCILDITATVFHILDISNTRTLKHTLEYFGIQNTAPLLEGKNFSQDYLLLPIIATCITSKLVILWLVNLFGSFLVIRQSKIIVYDRKLPLLLNNFPHKENGLGEGNSSKTTAEYPRSSLGMQTNRPETPQNRKPLESTSVEVLGTFKIQPISLSRHNSVLSEQAQEAGKGYHDERIQAGNNCDSDSLSRFSLSSSVSRVQAIKEKLHLTEELRSQLPWSYLNARNDIGTSIRVLAHHEHKDVLPPVPVPDYETKFQTQERPISHGYRQAHRPSALHHS